MFGVCGPVVMRTMSEDDGNRDLDGSPGCWSRKDDFVLLLLLLIHDCKNCSRFVR